MNLFFLAILLTNYESHQQEHWRTPGPAYQVFPLTLYIAALSLAPSTVDGRSLIPVVLLTRLLLLYPYLGFQPTRSSCLESRTSLNEVSEKQYDDSELWLGYKATIVTISIGYVLLQLPHLTRVSSIDFAHFQDIPSAVNNDSAVSALGYDLLLAISSLAVWYMARENPKTHIE
jgi:hypothetical protein